MRMRGLEPPRARAHGDLNAARLPIPPHPRAGEGHSSASASEIRVGWRSVPLLPGVAIVGLVVLVGVRYAFRQDAWLALVAGREIWQHGIPHHDALTSLAAGREWIDQQWLAQLTLYALDKLGGLALVALAYAALVVGSLTAAIVLGGRLGASARAQAWSFLPCAFLVLLAPVRTQPLAYPLFVAVVYLLARDSRGRGSSRDIYLTLVVLAFWANVHGSAALGAVLVVLRGVTLLLGAANGGRARGAVLTVGGPLCLLLTPYGLDTATYYRETLFRHDFTRLVSEWRPVTSAAVTAIPFFILLGGTVLSLYRNSRRLTAWELIAVAVLFASAASALRNVVWLALGLLLLPALELPRRGARSRGEGLRRALLVTTCVATVAFAVLTMTRDDRYFEVGHSQRALEVVLTQARRDPQIRIFADERYADWLLWRAPSLQRRIAFDVRFELLSRSELDAIADTLKGSGDHWQRGARGSRVVVLSPNERPDSARRFLAEPGRRILLRDSDAVVVLRPTEAAS